MSASLSQLQQQYQAIKDSGLALDMTRGKPSPNQLDLSNDMLSMPSEVHTTQDGVDVRNYGGLDGLAEMRQLFADMLSCQVENVIIGGNSSLQLMYDALARACLFGVPGSATAWSNVDDRKFICLVPGYDRHFAITAHLGFELISVAMNEDGPDMDALSELVAKDDSIKGVWCVPKYSNPTGAVYSDEVIQRLVSMPCAAKDFRIMWDNAYAEHHLSDNSNDIANILELAEQAGNPSRPLVFASTSKISLAGSGVAAIAANAENLADLRHHLQFQTIGPDKVNQLRHGKKFPDIAALRGHMQMHKRLLAPKFAKVLDVLSKNFSTEDGCQWSNPQGGYFVDLNVPDGLAKRVISLASAAGVKLTAAGATFPHGNDPRDRNIRIAPSFPEIDDIEQAVHVLCLCIKLAQAERKET